MFSPTNQDPANILGMTGFHSSNMCFRICFQIPRLSELQMPDELSDPNLTLILILALVPEALDEKK